MSTVWPSQHTAKDFSVFTLSFSPREYRIVASNRQLPLQTFLNYLSARGSVVVKALCYKPEGRGFEPHDVNTFFNLPNPSSRTRPWVSLSL
jgi:hypothetical protein